MKPYYYAYQIPEYGLVFSFNYRDGGRVVFNRRGSGYCGFDPERNRFVCRPAKEPKPDKNIRGTWRYRVYGDV